MSQAKQPVSTLQHVERIRERIMRGQMRELGALRSFISMTDGNAEAVERLRGPAGDLVLGKVSAFILKELGHETVTPVEAKASHVRREVTRFRGKANKLRDEPAIE
jgi:hypothetical protein